MQKKLIILNSILSILIVVLFLTDHISGFDTTIYNFLHQYEGNDMTNLFFSISEVVSIFGIICILFLLLFKNKRFSLLVCFNLVLSYAISSLLKLLFRRSRPIEIALYVESGYSMPSTHAMVSISFIGLISYFIYKNFEKGKLRTILLLFLSFYTFAIGISRIYLGVHYASDVLLGFSLGILYLIFFMKPFQKIILIKKDKDDKK